MRKYNRNTLDKRSINMYCSVIMFIRSKRSGKNIYLQIVENQRCNGKVRQTVCQNLGRLDVLRDTGKLDALLKSGLKFAKKLRVLDAYSKNETTTTETRKIGAPLLFSRLWKESGIQKTLSSFIQRRQFSFPVERAVFVTVLHRLINPGSDRAAERWMRDYAIDGIGRLELHHFYRAMGWLGEEVTTASGERRRVKDIIEEELFSQRKNLFSSMTLVFFDTTTLYFEGEGGETLGQYGHSKDHRADRHQIVVGVVLDDTGNPICSEILPGNTADVKTLVPVAERLQKRFGIGRICIVADRGMISGDTMDRLEKMGWSYILGVRLRRINEVATEVLNDPTEYREIVPDRNKSGDPSPLKVKEVHVGDRRYVVCRNEEQARKDQHDRAAIVAALREKLKQGNKSLVGNRGYRRYLKGPNAFDIDEEKIREEERFDGTWVLRTNTDLPPAEVALQYKQLWTVENIFRTMKSILETRPIFHKCDDTIRGHVFCSFLALVLRKNLQDMIASRGLDLEWRHIVDDVDAILEVEMTHLGRKYLIRTEAKRTAGKVFQAAGVGLPPVLREA